VAALIAFWIVRHGCAALPGSASLPLVAT